MISNIIITKKTQKQKKHTKTNIKDTKQFHLQRVHTCKHTQRTRAKQNHMGDHTHKKKQKIKIKKIKQKKTKKKKTDVLLFNSPKIKICNSLINFTKMYVR